MGIITLFLYINFIYTEASSETLKLPKMSRLASNSKSHTYILLQLLLGACYYLLYNDVNERSNNRNPKVPYSIKIIEYEIYRGQMWTLVKSSLSYSPWPPMCVSYANNKNNISIFSFFPREKLAIDKISFF